MRHVPPKRRNKLTLRHIPEDGILHSYRRENLKSYSSTITVKHSIVFILATFYHTPSYFMRLFECISDSLTLCCNNARTTFHADPLNGFGG
jgi:hypothetical protein